MATQIDPKEIKASLKEARTHISETEVKVRKGTPKDKDLAKLAKILKDFRNQINCW